MTVDDVSVCSIQYKLVSDPSHLNTCLLSISATKLDQIIFLVSLSQEGNQSAVQQDQKGFGGFQLHLLGFFLVRTVRLSEWLLLIGVRQVYYQAESPCQCVHMFSAGAR